MTSMTPSLTHKERCANAHHPLLIDRTNPDPDDRRCDLAGRVVKALRRAHAAVAAFGESGYDCISEPGNSIGPEKVLAEAAMLAYATQPLTEEWPVIAAAWSELTDSLHERARCPRVLIDVALHPAMFTKFAAPHILLSAMGVTHDRFDAMLRQLATSPLAKSSDETATAEIERRWLHFCWGAEWTDRDRADAFAESVLARPFDLLGALREDTYAFTHVLFYLTDFGRIPFAVPDAAPGLGQLADAMVAKSLDLEDYDLAGELLMARPLLRLLWSPGAMFALNVLREVENAVGALPGLATNLDTLALLSSPEARAYSLATGYHTALVMGLLCAVALANEVLTDSAATVRSTARGERAGAGRARQLIERAEGDQGHWQRSAGTSDTTTLQDLRPFLTDLSMARHARRREYGELCRLVVDANDAGLTHGPMVRQATELLARIAAASRYQ